MCSTVVVRCYDDLQSMEREICRLLKCDASGRRKPSCLSTEEFWRFKRSILNMLETKAPAEEKCFLPQNLLATAAPGGDEAVVVITMAWMFQCLHAPTAATEDEPQAGQKRKKIFDPEKYV